MISVEPLFSISVATQHDDWPFLSIPTCQNWHQTCWQSPLFLSISGWWWVALVGGLGRAPLVAWQSEWHESGAHGVPTRLTPQDATNQLFPHSLGERCRGVRRRSVTRFVSLLHSSHPLFPPIPSPGCFLKTQKYSSIRNSPGLAVNHQFTINDLLNHHEFIFLIINLFCLLDDSHIWWMLMLRTFPTYSEYMFRIHIPYIYFSYNYSNCQWYSLHHYCHCFMISSLPTAAPPPRFRHGLAHRRADLLDEVSALRQGFLGKATTNDQRQVTSHWWGVIWSHYMVNQCVRDG